MQLSDYLLLLLLLLLTGCEEPPAPVAISASPREFTLDFRNTDRPDTLLTRKHVTTRYASAVFRKIGGENALEIGTKAEFSDVLLNCESLFGHPVNFAEGRWLHLRLYVPEESWIRALKLNFADDAGNMGGIPEVANNFHGRYNEWFDVAVNLQELHQRYKNWNGEADLLSGAPYLSFNPYCASQEDTSHLYVSYMAMSDEKPTGDFAPALASRPVTDPNTKYKLTFDDPAVLHDLMAYRTFESSNQAMARGVAGNETMAIRVRGREYLNNIAFLPIMEYMTGEPVDFNEVSRIYFDYYLTPESEAFDGSTLTLATNAWKSVMTDSTFMTDFTRGKWTHASIDLADLDLKKNWGEQDVLSQVAELRININFRPEAKGIELWMDNFGWE